MTMTNILASIKAFRPVMNRSELVVAELHALCPEGTPYTLNACLGALPAGTQIDGETRQYLVDQLGAARDEWEEVCLELRNNPQLDDDSRAALVLVRDISRRDAELRARVLGYKL